MRLFDRAFTGSGEMLSLAETAVDKTYDKLGAAAPVAFGNTAYYLPCIYAYLGLKVTNMGELKAALEPIKALMTRNYRLHDVFTSGIATVLAAEVIEACKYAENPAPYGEKYHGRMTDAEVRELGVPLVTRDIPGFVVIIDEAPTDEQALALIKGYQSRGIFVFLLKGAIDQATSKPLPILSLSLSAQRLFSAPYSPAIMTVSTSTPSSVSSPSSTPSRPLRTSRSAAAPAQLRSVSRL
mgnify:CR=1 FL=1